MISSLQKVLYVSSYTFWPAFPNPSTQSHDKLQVESASSLSGTSIDQTISKTILRKEIGDALK